MAKNSQMVIFKYDTSLDVLFSKQRVHERLKVIDTPHMSAYLMDLIRDKEDFKEALRMVNNAPTVENSQKSFFFKRDNSVDALFSRLSERVHRCP